MPLVNWAACGCTTAQQLRARADEISFSEPITRPPRPGTLRPEFLRDEHFRESLERYGVIVVEGFTDRLRLH